jgi:hypothetical protein
MIYYEFAEDLLDQIQFTKQIVSFFEDQRDNVENDEDRKFYASKLKKAAQCLTILELSYSIASNEHVKETTKNLDSKLKAVQDYNDQINGYVANIEQGINALYFIAQLAAVCISL